MEPLDLSSGERLAVEELGDGDPVVLLPGVLGTRETWRPVADRLAGQHRVVMVDLVGFGDSSRPGRLDALWADSQAAAVAEALDARGVSGAVVAGHDYGGPVAAHLLATRPDLVSRLCLCSTNIRADTPIPMPIAAVTWPLVGGLFARMLMSGPALDFSTRRAVGKTRHRVRIEGGDKTQQASTRLVFTAALRDLAERYAPVQATIEERRVPALVLWGDRDPFFDAEQGRRTAELAGADLRLYAGGGHFLPLERPDDVAREIAAFARADLALA